MIEPFPLIEVSGPPRERGRQYGAQAASRIARGVEHYTAQLARSSCDWPTIRGLVQDYLPQVAAFEPAYVDEMRGIAEGAGLDFEAVVLLNARTEILKLGASRRGRGAERGRAAEPGGATEPAETARPDGGAERAETARRDGGAERAGTARRDGGTERAGEAREPASPIDACTGVVALPEATQERRLIHAQNWDWKVECAETAVVLSIRRDGGPDLLTFTEAGGLARSGFNAAGIAITANYLESDRDYCQTGVPLALIRRKVLECEHLALALRAVYATPKSAANNMIVSHVGGIAIDFECAPDETFQVHPERGLLVHANHWISPVALAKLKDTGIANTPCTLYRDLRVRALLAPRIGSLTRGAVKAALFDDFAAPWSVCRPPRASVNGTMTATVAMIVMEPALGVMEVAPLPALNRRFTTYRLEARRPAAAAVAG